MQQLTDRQIYLIKHSWTDFTGRLDTLSGSVIRNMIRLTVRKSKVTKMKAATEVMLVLLQFLHEVVVTLPARTHLNQNAIAILDRLLIDGFTAADFDVAVMAFLLTLEKKLPKSFSCDVKEAWAFLLSALRHQAARLRQERERTEFVSIL